MHSFYWLFLLLLTSCSSKDVKSEKAKEKNYPLFEARDYTDSLFSIGIEGPCYYKGFLYLVNLHKRGNIARVDSNGKATMFLELPAGSIGNGIRFNRNGQMLVADYKNHNILAVDINAKQVSVFAHESKMNQPNDLVVTRDGKIFAADPDWSTSTGNLWRIDQDKSVHLLESNMGTTNGIEISPDEKFLYINESVQRKIWKYSLDQNGGISNKTLFTEFPDFGLDGMHADSLGNLYVTRFGKGTIAVLSPEGEIIREVKMKGKTPTNLAFGGKDGKTVFVTMQDRRRVEVFINDVAGREYIR